MKYSGHIVCIIHIVCLILKGGRGGKGEEGTGRGREGDGTGRGREYRGGKGEMHCFEVDNLDCIAKHLRQGAREVLCSPKQWRVWFI